MGNLIKNISPISLVSDRLKTDIKNNYICVGTGYNLLESPYISPEFMVVTNKIIDIDAKDVTSRPSTIFGKYEIITENSVSDVYKEFNKKLKSKVFCMFSASSSTEFSQSSYGHEEYAYTKLFSYFVKNRQTIDIPESKYKLNAEFEKDISGTMTPLTLFSKYGTHMIKDVFMGGRLELNYTTKKTVKDTNASIWSDTESSYFFVTGSLSLEHIKKTKELSEKSGLNLNIVGGSSPSIREFEDMKVEYGRWCASLDEPKNCAPCGIADHNSLVPIWTFCKDPSRSKKIEAEFNRLANNIVLPEDRYITNILVVSNKNKEVAKSCCPPGYLLIDTDLNKDSGGDYIYFCIQRGKRENAITNIVCEVPPGKMDEATFVDVHNGVKASYVRTGTDLNKGAGGKYLYLMYTRDPRYKPIRVMTVYMDGESISEEWNGRMCYLNTTQTADLNWDAKGRYIYVGYKS